MKLLIDIPKEFEQHFQTDGFEDSLHRLSADAHLLAGNYEQETAVMLIEAFASAVPVPPHGRLIDADALDELLADMAKEYPKRPLDSIGGYWIDKFRNMLKATPTIIPTEESE